MSLDPEQGHLLALHIRDDVVSWENAGFSVVNGAVVLDDVTLFLAGRVSDERGLSAWSLAGGTQDVDGLTSVPYPFGAQAHAPPDHPNGVTSIDHVVVQTADFGRTIPELEAVGLELRRTRTFDFGGGFGRFPTCSCRLFRR